MEQVAHHLEEKERTRDIEIDENVTFSDLLLSEPVLAGLHAAGFRRPSPIQLAAIPLGRCGLDLVVQAKSGTGKTCVLAVVVLEAVSAASTATQAVVVAPTREVAVQVAQVVSTLASAMPSLSTAAFIGGTKLADDKAKLKNCQVVVGTPGRLAQLVSLGHLRLQCVRLLVLDEADRLLEGNFLGPVTDLASALPFNKQVLCLSATFSDSAAAQAEGLMRSPSHVRLDRESPALLGVNQVVHRLDPVASPHMRQAAKEAELLRLLSHVTFNQCLVFSGSQMRAESVCHRLKAEGWPAAYLTAAQSQIERLAAMEALCSHRCRILVATDLAARGLDSAHVNLVVSLDLPPEPATYLHRAGRAGRYGSRGAAVMLVCGPEEWYGIRAIATLANVKLLLTGQKWVNHLATKKVEGGRRPGAGKEEENMGVEESEERKKAGVEKQQKEEKGGEKSQEGRRGVEVSKEGEEGKVSRLEEVDHLSEEEARAWLKTHKPYKKEPTHATSQPENKVLQVENKNKPVKGDNKNLKNGLESKAKYDINAQIHTDHEVSKKKSRKKKQPHSETSNHRGDGGQREAEGEEEEEKETKRKNCEKNSRCPHTHINGDRKTHTNAQEHKEQQESDKDKQGIKAEKDPNTKMSVMSLVGRLWQRHPPVTMSYSNLLSDCTAQYSTSSPAADTRFRVPPWPVQVNPSEEELSALERHLNEMQEEVKERKQAWDGVRFDALAVLGAMAEGKDARKMLEETTQPASSVLSSHNASSSSTSQSMHSDHSSSSSSTGHPLNTQDHKQLLSSSKEEKHKTSSSHNSKGASSSSSDPESTCTRQKHISSTFGHKQFLSPTEHTMHFSPTLRQAPSQPQTIQPPHRATGTCPKIKKQARKQKKEQQSKEGAPSDPTHYEDYQYGNQSSQMYNDNYQAYNQWYPSYDQNYQDYSQAYQNYNQEHYHDQTYQTYTQGHQDYSFHQGQGYHQYIAPASHLYTQHGYTQVDGYIKSACKFASMMEYVRTMGRVSLHVAQDYHSRKKQWHEQQTDGWSAVRPEPDHHNKRGDRRRQQQDHFV